MMLTRETRFQFRPGGSVSADVSDHSSLISLTTPPVSAAGSGPPTQADIPGFYPRERPRPVEQNRGQILVSVTVVDPKTVLLPR